jgi:hypothetical protein
MKLRTFAKLRPLALFSLAALTTLTFSCASHAGGAGVATTFGDSEYSSNDDYDVKIVQSAYPMSFPKADKGSIDVSFDITIKNHMKTPVLIDRISLQSMSGSLYRLETSSRQYKQTIAAGGEYQFKFWAPALVQGTMFDSRAPMVVRAVVDTVVGDVKTREIFNREVNENVGVAAQIGGH